MPAALVTTSTFSLLQVLRAGVVLLYKTVGSGTYAGRFAVFVAVRIPVVGTDVGEVYYRESRDPTILTRASNAVAGSQFSATYVIIATWHKVSRVNVDNGTPVSLFCAHTCY